MIIKTIKNSLICMGLILLSNALVEGITENNWQDLLFEGGILLMGVLYCLWQVILQQIHFSYYLLEIVVNFLGTLLLALILGKWFGWYSDLSNIIYVCIEVVIVFVVGYFLGMMKTKQDVKRINQVLSRRKG